MLAFDDGRHVAQLQVRPYEPGTRSPDGLDDPLYWMDFADRSPSVPDGAVAVFCYHVGQVDDSEERDPAYWGAASAWRCSMRCWHGPMTQDSLWSRRVCRRIGPS